MSNLTAIRNRMKEVQVMLANEGFPHININVQIVRLRHGVAGMALLWNDAIQISEDYLREYPEHILKETVPHEVCHIYVQKYFPRKKQHHGPEFRSLMARIGCVGSTHHTLQLKEGPKKRTYRKIRYVYTTANTKKEVFLTSQQHTKQQNWAKLSPGGKLGRSFFNVKGEPLVFTGNVKEI